MTEVQRMAPGGHDFVRPFIMTGGRARTRGHLNFETLVRARAVEVPATLSPEQRAMLARSGEPVSVAELSAELDLVLSVTCVLLGDLHAAGLLEVLDSDPDTIDFEMLAAMAERIRNL